MSEMTEQEFWAILQATPVIKPIFYRLYYNDDGSPIFYSMEELSGNYIEIDQQTYALASFNVRVINGKLIHINLAKNVKKLQPSTKGTTCDPRDVCVIVNADQPHTKWTMVNNEID